MTEEKQQSQEANVRRLWFVVPAYNEAATIKPITQQLRKHGNVVVVDDASTDRTGIESCAAGAHLVTLPVNRGQGAALQTGIEYALAQDATHIVTFDADGQHHLDDALRMVDRLDTEALDIVLGSRFLGSTVNMPIMRAIVLKAAVLFTRTTTGLDLTDTHNGLRAMTSSAARRIELTQDRMAHASEFLSLIAAQKLRMAEEPVTITYTTHSLKNGQRLRNSVGILEELAFARLTR